MEAIEDVWNEQAEESTHNVKNVIEQLHVSDDEPEERYKAKEKLSLGEVLELDVVVDFTRAFLPFLRIKRTYKYIVEVLRKSVRNEEEVPTHSEWQHHETQHIEYYLGPESREREEETRGEPVTPKLTRVRDKDEEINEQSQIVA